MKLPDSQPTEFCPSDLGHEMPSWWIQTQVGRCARCGMEVVRAKGRRHVVRLPLRRKWIAAEAGMTCDWVLAAQVHES